MYDKFEKREPFALLDTSKYPPEVAGRFNSFITTQFDDSLSVEMQMRSIIKWAIDNFKEMDQTYNDFTEYILNGNINPFIEMLNDLIEYMNYFISEIDNRLAENIGDILSVWLDDGTLAEIINNDVFDMKADKTFVDSEIERLDQKDENLTTQLAQIVVNVKRFGAKGNGITDDSDAIRLALSFIRENGGGTLYFPIGTYLVSGYDDLVTTNPQVTFYMDMDNLTIKGESRKGSIIKVADGEIREALFGNYTHKIFNIEMTNITIDFNGKNNLPTRYSGRPSYAGILAYFVDGYHIHHCDFLNASGEHVIYGGNPLNQNNGMNMKVNDNLFMEVGNIIEGNQDLMDHSTLYVSGKHIRIFNNDFINSDISRRATAIESEGINVMVYNNFITGYQLPFINAALSGHWQGGLFSGEKNIVVENTQIYNNTVENCLDGWLIQVPRENGFKNVKFYSNNITLSEKYNNNNMGSRYMVRCLNLDVYPVEDLEIYDNVFRTDGDYETAGFTSGVNIDKGERVSIRNNHFMNIASSGIRVTSNLSKDISVKDNTFIDVAVNSGEDIKSVIIFPYGGTNVNIERNKISRNKYGKIEHGIEFRGVKDNVLIKDNQIDGVDTPIYTSVLNDGDVLVVFHKATEQFNVEVINASKGSEVEFLETKTTHKMGEYWNTFDFGTEMPSYWTGRPGDYRTNTEWSELGESGQKYVLKGWIRTSYDGIWVEERTPIVR